MERLKITKYFRGYDKYLQQVKLIGMVSPNTYTMLSFASVFLFLFTENAIWSFIWIAASLIFDALDGVSARINNSKSTQGYLIDVTFDHLGNSLILLKIIDTGVGVFFTLLHILNIVLSYISFKTGTHIMFPVRILILISLLIKYFAL